MKVSDIARLKTEQRRRGKCAGGVHDPKDRERKDSAMDRDKPRAHRPCRRVTQKREGLANFLNQNLLKLGAGVSISLAMFGSPDHLVVAGPPESSMTHRQLIEGVVQSNPFVEPTVLAGGLFPMGMSSGEIIQTSDLQRSELRLKSIGTAVGLVPIGNPHSVSPSIEIKQPHASKIRVNPMAGGSIDLLEQPVTSLHGDSDEPQFDSPIECSHPQILLLRRSDSPPIKVEPLVTAEATTRPKNVVAAEVVITDDAPIPLTAPEQPSDASLEDDASEATGVTFSFSDVGEVAREAPAVDVESETDKVIADVVARVAAPFMIPPPSEITESVVVPITDRESRSSLLAEGNALPLLPAPDRGWFAPVSQVRVNPKYSQRHRQHVDVAAPPMNSAARSRPEAVPATRIVLAKFAGFLPKKPTQSKDMSVDRPLVNPIDELKAAIDETHPNARVSLSEVNNRMVVRGVCRDREQATEIIRRVRSRFLVPVDDQLIIR